MKKSTSLAVLALLVGYACTDASHEPDRVARVDTLADGSVVITNSPPGRWSVTGSEPWALREELRIGSLGGEHDVFSRIEAIEVGRDGRIYVLDRGPRTVTAFDASGNHVVTFAGEGEGPGELRFPVSLSASPEDGSLWVADFGTDRFTVFDPDGELLATHRYPADEIVGRGDFGSDGRFRDLSFRRLLVLDRELLPVLEIPMPDFEAEVYRPRAGGGSGGAVVMAAVRPVPFSARQVSALDPDGSLWTAITDEYRITRLGEGGDTLATIVLEGATRLPVTAEERDWALEELEPLADRYDVDVSRIPDEKPFFTRFLFADDGHLWVELETEPGFPGQRFDVFDPDGVYLGPVETELVFEEMLIRDGFVYGVVTGDLEVAYVVRARIEGRG